MPLFLPFFRDKPQKTAKNSHFPTLKNRSFKQKQHFSAL
jgi:hypothetical protein